MSKKETKKLPEATVENLKEEIRTYHRETVLELMKNGALRNAEPAEKTELYRKITGLRSIELVEQIVADEAKLEPEYLQIDFSNYSNREFVQQVLKKCRKSLDLSADSTVSRFFILACDADDTDTIRFLLKQKKYSGDISKISELPVQDFKSVIRICQREIEASKSAADFYIAAGCSEHGTEKVTALIEAGYNLNAKNEQNQTLEASVTKRVNANKYPGSKDGKLAKVRDQQILNLLKPKVESEDERKKNMQNRLIIGVIIAAAVVAVIAIIVSGNKSSSTSSTTSSVVTSTESSALSGTSSTISAADTSSMTLNTDTSLTVAKGDTVNIDYTGYVDGKQFDGGTATGQDLTIGSGTFIDGFEDQLIGAKVGSTVTVTVTFPEDYGVDSLNGKEATFNVKINGIYQ